MSSAFFENEIPDSQLRSEIERLADQLCWTVDGDFGRLIRLDVTDDTLEKLQMLVNFVLDTARRASEARREAERLSAENDQLRAEATRAMEMGSYRLLELLGEGGMGEVWSATHSMLARPAAIKLIKPDALSDGDSTSSGIALKRFELEAQATASLRSPHTIAIYDYGIAEGHVYYVMELLDGTDLRTLVEMHGPQPPERVVYYLRQACHSLEEAHENGLVHRDIKPANLFSCRYGLDVDFLKLLDFGLVKANRFTAARVTDVSVTREGTISGTPAFMAPEMVTANDEVDARSDLYSLACTAYWMLSGELVFDAPTPMEVMACHIRDNPRSLAKVPGISVPEKLDRLLLRCLEKDPKNRPQGAYELKSALEAIDLPAEWTEDRAREWWGRNRTPRSAASGGLRSAISRTLTCEVSREKWKAGGPTL